VWRADASILHEHSGARTLSQYQLPVKVDDHQQRLGQGDWCAEWQESFYGEALFRLLEIWWRACLISPALAEAFGVRAGSDTERSQA